MGSENSYTDNNNNNNNSSNALDIKTEMNIDFSKLSGNYSDVGLCIYIGGTKLDF